MRPRATPRAGPWACRGVGGRAWSARRSRRRWPLPRPTLVKAAAAKKSRSSSSSSRRRLPGQPGPRSGGPGRRPRGRAPFLSWRGKQESQCRKRKGKRDANSSPFSLSLCRQTRFFCAFTFTALLFPSFFFVFDEGRELEERRKKRSLQIISLSSKHAVQAHVVEHQVAHVDPAAVKRAPRVIVIVVSGTEGGRRGGPRRRLPEQQALPGRREREPERASASSSAAAPARPRGVDGADGPVCVGLDEYPEPLRHGVRHSGPVGKRCKPHQGGSGLAARHRRVGTGARPSRLIL